MVTNFSGMIELENERRELEAQSDSADSEKEAEAGTAPIPIEINIMAASDPDVGASLTDSMLRKRRNSLAGRRKSFAQLELREKVTGRALKHEFDQEQQQKDSKISRLRQLEKEARGKLEGSIHEIRRKHVTLLEEVHSEREKVKQLKLQLTALQRYVEDKEREFLDKRMAEIDDYEAIIAGIRPRPRRGSRAGLGHNTKSDEDLVMGEEEIGASGHSGSTSMAAAMCDLPIFAKRGSTDRSPSPRERLSPPVKSPVPWRSQEALPTRAAAVKRSRTPNPDPKAPLPKTSRRALSVTERLYKTPKDAGVHSQVARAEQEKRAKLKEAAEEKRKRDRQARRAAANLSPFSSQSSLSRASPVPSRGSSPSGSISPVPVEKSSTTVQLRGGGSRTVRNRSQGQSRERKKVQLCASCAGGSQLQPQVGQVHGQPRSGRAKHSVPSASGQSGAPRQLPQLWRRLRLAHVGARGGRRRHDLQWQHRPQCAQRVQTLLHATEGRCGRQLRLHCVLRQRRC